MTDQSILEEILDYLKSSDVAFVDRFVPYFVSSIGCHIANLRNKKFEITKENGWQYDEWHNGYNFYVRSTKIVDMRLHTFFVAPPAGSKSFFFELFLDDSPKTPSLLLNSGFPVMMKGRVTEAGIVGSAVLTKNGKSKKLFGLAEKYPNGIIGFEEANKLFDSQVTYNEGLENALLSILDSGHATKDLAAISINYRTFITTWMATQTQRFKTGSGLARRFLFLNFNPTQEDLQTLANTYEEGSGVAPNWTTVHRIRERVKQLYHHFRPRRVTWDDAYIKLKNKLNPSLPERVILDKLAIGYNVMQYYQPDDETLHVTLDFFLEDLIERAAQMRDEVLGNTEELQLIKFMGSKEWRVAELKRAVRRLDISYKRCGELLDGLIKDGVVTNRKEPGATRPKRFYRVVEDWEGEFDVHEYHK